MASEIRGFFVLVLYANCLILPSYLHSSLELCTLSLYFAPPNKYFPIHYHEQTVPHSNFIPHGVVGTWTTIFFLSGVYRDLGI